VRLVASGAIQDVRFLSGEIRNATNTCLVMGPGSGAARGELRPWGRAFVGVGAIAAGKAYVMAEGDRGAMANVGFRGRWNQFSGQPCARKNVNNWLMGNCTRRKRERVKELEQWGALFRSHGGWADFCSARLGHTFRRPLRHGHHTARLIRTLQDRECPSRHTHTIVRC